MMKKTIGMLLLLCLPLSMQAQLFNEDGYEITRMTNLSNEVSKVDSEGFSMCGLCFAHFDKGDIIFLNITIGTTTPYDFDEGHSSLMLVFLEDQVKRLPIKPENILELSSFTHPEQANGIWVVNCSIRLSPMASSGRSSPVSPMTSSRWLPFSTRWVTCNSTNSLSGPTSP